MKMPILSIILLDFDGGKWQYFLLWMIVGDNILYQIEQILLCAT
jgi:hypothetical protein